MEKNSTTIILIVAIIFIISAAVVFCLKFNTGLQNEEKEITEQVTTNQQTNKIQTNKVQNNKVQNNKLTTNTKDKDASTNILLQSNKYSEELLSNAKKAKKEQNIFLTIVLVMLLFLCIIPTIAYWKIYSDNGESGWASIVPIYNIIVLYRIVGLKEWYVLLTFIPYLGAILSTIISIYASYLLAQKYNKGVLFAIGIMFLPFMFLPILAFSKLPKGYDDFYESY